MTDIAVIEVWAAPREDMTQGRVMTECENKTDSGGDWHQQEERPIKIKINSAAVKNTLQVCDVILPHHFRAGSVKFHVAFWVCFVNKNL